MCVLVLTTHAGGSPVHRDTILTAFVCICCNTGAQTFTVTPTVAVAGVRQTVLIKPGHIHLWDHND